MGSKKYGIKSIDVVLVKGDEKITIKSENVRVSNYGSNGIIEFRTGLFDEQLNDYARPDKVELHKECKAFENGEDFFKIDTYENIERYETKMEYNRHDCYYENIVKIFFIR